jgi:putative CocE/NonD family hydrolase
MVKLLDVHPNGFAQRLCDSMVRARYRDGFTDPQPITPGTVYHYTIDLWNTAQVFQPGHAIRIEIASSAFPKYDRHRNVWDDLATGTEMALADQQVFHDAEHPSHVVLPIIR